MFPWLLPLPLASAPPWPVPISAEAQVERVDLNGDGAAEERLSETDGGSGWHQWTRCVRDGASGDAACEIVRDTATALFSASLTKTSPAGPNRAAALLPDAPCAAPDPEAPAQGMLWALRGPLPKGGALRPTGPWRAGPPVDQQSVCLSVAEAAKRPGGLAWTGGDPDTAGEGWKVRYSASRPIWVAPGEARRTTPQRVGEVGALQVYQLGHALAVYDPARDRHAWVLNLEAAQDTGFKFDRWESIAGVEAVSPTRLRVALAGWLTAQADEALTLDLTGLVGPATP